MYTDRQTYKETNRRHTDNTERQTDSEKSTKHRSLRIVYGSITLNFFVVFFHRIESVVQRDKPNLKKFSGTF